MTTYFTSDLHLAHDSVIRYCNRPFKNSAEMFRVLKDNWNSIVCDSDDIYIIGDFSLREQRYHLWYCEVVRSLNGRKHLILGNHDKLKPFDYIDCGFTTVHTGIDFKDKGITLFHDPAASCILEDHIWLCGHVHTLFKTCRNVINVGVDVNDYKPISMGDVRKTALEELNWKKEIHDI